jgi:hypothetical protein
LIRVAEFGKRPHHRVFRGGPDTRGFRSDFVHTRGAGKIIGAVYSNFWHQVKHETISTGQIANVPDLPNMLCFEHTMLFGFPNLFADIRHQYGVCGVGVISLLSCRVGDQGHEGDEATEGSLHCQCCSTCSKLIQVGVCVCICDMFWLL